MLAIGVDVGGTKVLAGVVDESGAVLARTRRPTPSHDPAATADAIVAVIEELRSAYDAGPVGLGAAGFVDADRSTVLFAPNLAWRHEPLRDRIAGRVGVPVVVENDANAAAWAEFRFGAGRGERDLVVITVGTGIGCGLVLGGALYRGRWGIAGEAGHLVVQPGGQECGCGNHGCWEQYASGTAIGRLGGGSGEDVTAAAQAGDPAAIGVLAEVGRWLGLGLANLAAVLDPGAFVVGGGAMAAGELLLEPARSAYAETLTGRGHRPVAAIRAARLGDQAGLVGAADLARGQA